MSKTAGRTVVAAAAAALISMLIVGSFVGALHRPAPRGIPVAVVGPGRAVAGLAAALGHHAPGAFDLRRYATRQQASAAILNQNADAALVLGAGRQRLLVAGAAGPFITQAVTATFRAEAAAARQPLAIADIRPLPPGDASGISSMFLVLGLTLPSIGFGILLVRAVGRPLPAAAQLAVLAVFAVATGAAATWVADGLIGALTGAPAGLFGIAALIAFAVSAAGAAAARLAPPLAVGAALLFVPVGVPASGGPAGASLVTPWYSRLGSALPFGAGHAAVRDVVYFTGNALGGPATVLGLWAAASAAALFIPRLRGRHDAPQPGEAVPQQA